MNAVATTPVYGPLVFAAVVAAAFTLGLFVTGGRRAVPPRLLHTSGGLVAMALALTVAGLLMDALGVGTSA